LFPVFSVQKVSNRQSPKAFDKVGVAKIVSTAWCNSSGETGIENFFTALAGGDGRICLVLLMVSPGASSDAPVDDLLPLFHNHFDTLFPFFGRV
jgi:hypothetical protein